jgi:hypothetical protein
MDSCGLINKAVALGSNHDLFTTFNSHFEGKILSLKASEFRLPHLLAERPNRSPFSKFTWL